MTRVSVVVPVRDRRALLRRLLDGLDEQTFRSFEVVIVDDGSTDGSAAEAEADAAAGRPVRVVRTGGVGAVGARRAGTAVAAGEILAFTDSDCVPRLGWLEAGVRAVDAGADVVQGITVPARPAGPLERTMRVGRDDGVYPTCNVFYRRSAFDAAGGFDPSAGERLGFRPGTAARHLGFGEDTLLGWRVRRAGRSAFAPEAVVEHHVFERDLRDSLRREWMSGAFPALVREVPELRRTALRSGFLLGTTRLPLYGAVVAMGARRPVVAAACTAVWLTGHARRGQSVSRTPARRAGAAVASAGLDVVRGAALLVGSVRARTVVL